RKLRCGVEIHSGSRSARKAREPLLERGFSFFIPPRLGANSPTDSAEDRRIESPTQPSTRSGPWRELSSIFSTEKRTSQIQPYFRVPHIYIGLPFRFRPERKVVPEHPYPGVSDGLFMTSRAGLHWDRRFME